MSCTYTLHEIVSLFIIKFFNFTAKRWMKGGARHRGSRGGGRGDSRGGWRRDSRGGWRGDSRGGWRRNSRGGSSRGNRRGNIQNIEFNFNCY